MRSSSITSAGSESFASDRGRRDRAPNLSRNRDHHRSGAGKDFPALEPTGELAPTMNVGGAVTLPLLLVAGPPLPLPRPGSIGRDCALFAGSAPSASIGVDQGDAQRREGERGRPSLKNASAHIVSVCADEPCVPRSWRSSVDTCDRLGWLHRVLHTVWPTASSSARARRHTSPGAWEPGIQGDAA
jgi:hypothetical protein